MSNKSCYYLCLVGCLPDKDECKKKHPEGCEGCDLYLEDPTPDTVVENKVTINTHQYTRCKAQGGG